MGDGFHGCLKTSDSGLGIVVGTQMQGEHGVVRKQTEGCWSFLETLSSAKEFSKICRRISINPVTSRAVPCQKKCRCQLPVFP